VKENYFNGLIIGDVICEENRLIEEVKVGEGGWGVGVTTI